MEKAVHVHTHREEQRRVDPGRQLFPVAPSGLVVSDEQQVVVAETSLAAERIATRAVFEGTSRGRSRPLQKLRQPEPRMSGSNGLSPEEVVVEESALNMHDATPALTQLASAVLVKDKSPSGATALRSFAPPVNDSASPSSCKSDEQQLVVTGSLACRPSPALLPIRAPSKQQHLIPSQERLRNVRSPSRSPQHHFRRTLAAPLSLDHLPNEVLLQILGYLDVDDLLTTSRTSQHLRCLAVAPILHTLRRRQIRAALPPLLVSPMRPSLSDLIHRHIFLTSTTVVSRKLTRSLVSIRLSRRLAARPSVHVLVERCVLPPECAPGIGHVAPALAARTRAVEREKLKDGLRRWMGSVWLREADRRSERVRKCDEKLGVGKVWQLRKFWERVSHSNGNVTEV